jgi:hypothetical protein
VAERSRIASARQRASTSKRVLAGLAAVSFVAAALLARATHPGKATSSSNSGSSSSPKAVTSSDDGESEGGSGSGNFAIAPSNSAPQAQTNVS